MYNFEWVIRKSITHEYLSIVVSGISDSCIYIYKEGLELPPCGHLGEIGRNYRLIQGKNYSGADSGLSQSGIDWIRRTLFEF
jgi:hypothetical protein